MDKVLLYISAICWNDVNNEEVVTNVKDLQKNQYVTVPKESYEAGSHFNNIDQTLTESTDVRPWYYNIDFVCEV